MSTSLSPMMSGGDFQHIHRVTGYLL